MLPIGNIYLFLNVILNYMERELLRNRKATEQRLLSAIQELIEESGFEKLGINAVASKAGVSKMLIYRYFGSLDGLVAAIYRTV